MKHDKVMQDRAWRWLLGLVAAGLGIVGLAGAAWAAPAAEAKAKSDPKAWKLQTRPANPTTCPIGPRSAKVRPWQAIFRGIDYAMAETDTPRPLKVHAARIDLREPTISFFVTPSNGKPGEADAEKATTFLRKYRCQLAINATPWDRLVKEEGQPVRLTGLSMSRGDCYSPPAPDTYGSLLISKDNKAWIAQPPVSTKGAYNGVGGFRMLLWRGRNVAWDDFLQPRTAAGVSKDGRYLYLVVIDGRQKGYSEGVTTGEEAEWMRMFGAYDALNLDGGGSSVMVIDDGQGGAKVLNRPIEAGVPGRERITANHLGVYAKPVEGAASRP
ncbi:MAG: phosphodiester glycosidase family protein [Phycisphaerae bacterium]